MKSLLLLAAIAGTAYVSYSYTSTDGKSCLVCPMTGEPVFTSAEPEVGSCCAGGKASLLTGLPADGPSCCSEASGSCCPKGDTNISLTSSIGAECEASGEKSCCKDKENAVDVTDVSETVTETATVTETEEAVAPESEAKEVVAELTEAE